MHQLIDWIEWRRGWGAAAAAAANVRSHHFCNLMQCCSVPPTQAVLNTEPTACRQWAALLGVLVPSTVRLLCCSCRMHRCWQLPSLPCCSGHPLSMLGRLIEPQQRREAWLLWPAPARQHLCPTVGRLCSQPELRLKPNLLVLSMQTCYGPVTGSAPGSAPGIRPGRTTS